MERLQRAASDLRQELISKEDQRQRELAESRQMESEMERHCRQLETTIDAANADTADLRAKVSSAEGSVVALESRLAQVDEERQELEFKLSSVVSSIRRTVGIGGNTLPRNGELEGSFSSSHDDQLEAFHQGIPI